MLDSRRTLYVTEHYAHLQGLRIVPLGFCFVGSAAWRAGLLAWLPGITGRGAQAWFLISVAIALVVSFPIRGFYKRRVGNAYPRATRTGAGTLTMSFVSVVLLVTAPPTAWPVSMAVVFVAFSLAFLGCVERGVRRHYLSIAAACLLFALAPLVGVPKPARNVGLDLLIGLGLIVAGIGDDLVLRRAVHAPEGVSHDRAA